MSRKYNAHSGRQLSATRATLSDTEFTRLPQYDERIACAYIDSDGYWIELKRGWTADPRDAHDIHEGSAVEANSRRANIVECCCNSCTPERIAQ